MSSPFSLAVCAEMVFTDLPVVDRVKEIHSRGYLVEIWDWSNKDLEALAATGATFSSMTGYLRGELIGADGATSTFVVHSVHGLEIRREVRRGFRRWSRVVVVRRASRLRVGCRLSLRRRH